VNIRRQIYRRLFLQPGISTIYYDYERDLDYPERAESALLQYVNLDESPDKEALITFIRFGNPVALILQKSDCGWRLIAAMSAWLRFEDYPYDNWLELVQTIRPGVHEILVRESLGDGAQYFRKARLLKLINGVLRQIAEIEEETIKPLDGYTKSDWNDVKHHQISHLKFFPTSSDQPAQIKIETITEVIRYSGNALSYKYWLEADGSWHSAKQHWRKRSSETKQLLESSVTQLVWQQQSSLFVKG
ncbi:MAG: hypothetical protein AB1489_35630, partial [Acidobacteriota bacterium]